MPNEKDVNLDEKQEEIVIIEDENNDKTGEITDKGEEELDPYEKYLKQLEEENERLKAEKEKAEEIARQKSGAITEERQKRKELEDKLEKGEKEGDSSKYLTAEQLDRMLDEREAKRERLSKVNELTQNPKERELVLKIMELKNVSPEDAYILANAHIIKEAKQEDIDEESFVASFSGGNVSSQNGYVSPVQKMATEGLTDAEKKKLKL
jgi:hypothetical protein